MCTGWYPVSSRAARRCGPIRARSAATTFFAREPQVGEEQSLPLLSGTVAIVSGIGPGTGTALAASFAQHGAKVMLSARTDRHLEPILDLISALGGMADFQACDITDPVQCRALVDKTVERFGKLDTLAANAFAMGRPGPIETAELARDWNPAWKVNVIGTMQLCQAALPALKRSRQASIVIINSMTSRVVPEHMAAYGISKAALLHAARALAGEVGKYGIRVNSVVPSHIDGPNTDVLIQMNAEANGTDIATERKVIEDLGVLGHITSPQQVADAAVFLASRLSTSITGQAIDVNAGQLFT